MLVHGYNIPFYQLCMTVGMFDLAQNNADGKTQIMGSFTFMKLW